MQDYRVKATAAFGAIRAIATRTTKTAQQVQIVQNASPVAAAALGRLISGAVMLTADFKTEFRLMIEVDGNGPLGRTVAEVRTGGLVRARAQNPKVDLSLRPDGKLAVGKAVGNQGILRVVREEAGQAPYEGQTALLSGEIGEDLTRYYFQSEQVPSAVAVGVLIGTDGLVAGAGGIVIQALPGSEAIADDIASRFKQLDDLSYRLTEGQSPDDLLRHLLPEPIVWYPKELFTYQCQCSREKSIAIVKSLPQDEVLALIQEHGAEVVCHYCNTAYPISLSMLEQIANR
ncbi:MAG: Hsp33 family molecular chaperone HslO [Firmicutes bacterium]|nr:Hsp33 family molecular chaperone HslO [Bacillota bacterium]